MKKFISFAAAVLLLAATTAQADSVTAATSPVYKSSVMKLNGTDSRTKALNAIHQVLLNSIASITAGGEALANAETIDTNVDASFRLGRNDAGTVTITSKDDDATAAITVNPGGTATLTLGGATDTVTVAATSGVGLSNAETLSNGTNGTITLGRDDAGTVTVTAADNDATAALTILPGGAAAMVLGGGSTTTATVTTDGTGDAEVVLPENSVGPDEIAVATDTLLFCGENAENGTIFFGPATAAFYGGATDHTMGVAACDALDNGVEATADAAVFTNVAYKVLGFWCRSDATMGAAETQTFTLRSAAADTTPVLSCVIATGESDCRTLSGSTTDIAAGATVAMQLVAVDNNADGDESWCRVAIALK